MLLKIQHNLATRFWFTNFVFSVLLLIIYMPFDAKAQGDSGNIGENNCISKDGLSFVESVEKLKKTVENKYREEVILPDSVELWHLIQCGRQSDNPKHHVNAAFLELLHSHLKGRRHRVLELTDFIFSNRHNADSLELYKTYRYASRAMVFSEFDYRYFEYIKYCHQIDSIQHGYVDSLSVYGDYEVGYYLLKDYPKSRSYLYPQLKHFKQEKLHYNLSSAYNDIGLTFTHTGQYDSATIYFDTALFYWEVWGKEKSEQFGINTNNPEYEQFKKIIFSNKAKLYLDSANAEEYLPFIEDAAFYNKYVGSEHVFNSNFLLLAQWYLDHGNIDKGEFYLNNVGMAKSANQYQSYISSLRLKALIESSKGNIVEANRIHNRAEELKDSINGYGQEYRIKSSIAKSRVDQIAMELKEAEIRDLSQKQELSKQRIRLVYAVSAIVVSLLIVTFLLLLYKRIKSQKKQKDFLYREMHHRISNNLHLISVFLSEQEGKIIDEKSKKVIYDSQQKIFSMSFIHHKVYQLSLTERLFLFDFIKEMVSHLAKSLNSNQLTVDFEYDVENVELEAQRALTLGLILNELITNSYKYAFTGIKQGSIKIHSEVMDKGIFKLIIAESGASPLSENLENLSSPNGLKVLKNLCKSLGSELIISSSTTGTCFEVAFKV